MNFILEEGKSGDAKLEIRGKLYTIGVAHCKCVHAILMLREPHCLLVCDTEKVLYLGFCPQFDLKIREGDSINPKWMIAGTIQSQQPHMKRRASQN